MLERSREKIALFIFVSLIILAISAFVGYIFAGHSWNVAASNIDDTFGSMDGYTVIVYPGTIEPLPEDLASSDASKLTYDKKGLPQVNNSSLGKNEYRLLFPEGMNRHFQGYSFLGNLNSSTDVSKPYNFGKETETPPANRSDSKEEETTSSQSELHFFLLKGIHALKLINAFLAEEDGVSVKEVQASYAEKNATVFALNTFALSDYREGSILKQGSHRFGVFSVEEPLSASVLNNQIEYFKFHEVDFLVVLTSDMEYVRNAEGIDIVISTQDEGLFVMGETIHGTFFVDTPEKGSVGAILISPSNVLSAKVIESL